MVRRSDEDNEAWSSYAREFGARLRQLREDRGLGQDELAYRAGLNRAVYQHYEKGEGRPGLPLNPGLRTLVAIAGVLGTDVGDLLPPRMPDLGER